MFKMFKKVREGYQDLSTEEKNKKRQYTCERYKNLSESNKQRPVEFRKKTIIKCGKLKPLHI